MYSLVMYNKSLNTIKDLSNKKVLSIRHSIRLRFRITIIAIFVIKIISTNPNTIDESVSDSFVAPNVQNLNL